MCNCSFWARHFPAAVAQITAEHWGSLYAYRWCKLKSNDDNYDDGYGEQGWRSGESARLPPMCPGCDSRIRRHMWAEFVGSLLWSERFFSGNSDFPLSSKTNIWFDLIYLIYSLPN